MKIVKTICLILMLSNIHILIAGKNKVPKNPKKDITRVFINKTPNDSKKPFVREFFSAFFFYYFRDLNTTKQPK